MTSSPLQPPFSFKAYVSKVDGFEEPKSGTTLKKYSPTVGRDDAVISGTVTYIDIKYQCITFIKEYENKSLEELRLEDYKAGRVSKELNLGNFLNKFNIREAQASNLKSPPTKKSGAVSAYEVLSKRFETKLFVPKKRCGVGEQGSGTTLVKYSPNVGLEFVQNPGNSYNLNLNYICITIMKEYENKSLEELRLEDYKAGRNLLSKYIKDLDETEETIEPNVFVFGFQQTYAFSFREKEVTDCIGEQSKGTTLVKYRLQVGKDIWNHWGQFKDINAKFHCITTMKEYENKSLEELRLEDYNAGMEPNKYTNLRFHTVHGANIKVSSDRTIAERTNSHYDALAFSSKPIRVGEEIYLRLNEISNQWRPLSGLNFGFTTENPSGIAHSIPKFASPTKNTWIIQVEKHLCKKGNIIHYNVNNFGELRFGVNGKIQDQILTHIDISRPLWAVIDVYGRCSKVQFVGPRALDRVRRTNQVLDDVWNTNQLVLEGVTNTNQKVDGVGRSDPIEDRARSSEPIVDGVTRSDPIVDGARSTVSIVDGVRRTEPIVDGVRRTDPIVDEARRSGHTSERARCSDHASERARRSDSVSDEARRSDYASERARRCDSNVDGPRRSDHASERARHSDPIVDEARRSDHASERARRSDSIVDEARRCDHASERARRSVDGPRRSNQVEDDPLINQLRSLSVAESLPAKKKDPVPIYFHRTKGRNIHFTGRGVAARYQGDNCQGYIFTSRPMRLGQTLTVQILDTEDIYRGSLAIGLTSCDPASLRPYELPDDAEFLQDRPEYWIVYPDAGNGLQIGDELDVTLTRDGRLEVRKNGSNPIAVLHVDHTLKLWAFFDVFGTTTEVRVLISEGVRGANQVLDGVTRTNQVLDGAKTPINVRERENTPSTSKNKAETKRTECTICFENQINSVIYRCGHMCMCYDCAVLQWKSDGKSYGKCPLCRAKIQDVIRTYNP